MQNTSKKKEKFFHSLILVLIVFFVYCLFYFFNGFSFLEAKTYDSRMKFAGKFTSPSEEICFIALDQESLDWGKEEMGWSWPWPRAAYADIVNYFTLSNAKALAFDMLFTEPSLYGKKDDEIFAAACKNNGKVIQSIFEEKSTGKLLYPISEIKESASELGMITSSMDNDDIIRRAKLFFTIDGEYFNSLGLSPLFLDLFQNPAKHISQGKDFSKLIVDTLGKSISSLQADGTLNLRFQSSIDDYLPYRASDILKSYYALTRGEEPLLSPENFTDTYCFFALYAPGLYDICSIPNNQVYPGVGVHITLLDNLLNNQFIHKTPWYFSVLWIFLLSFLGVFTINISEKQTTSKKTILSLLLIPTFTIVFVILISYFLFALGIWMPLINPILSFLSSFIFAFVFSYTKEGKQRRFIKNAFKQYVSPTVIENLIQNPEKLKLGGEKRRLSIFFSDIQGFTSISENMEPEELTEFLNAFLSEMSKIILENGGTIDKYEGDAIVAFWNAPADTENHEVCALTAALQCQKKLEELRENFTYRLGSPIYMRIGLNVGDAVVGNLGSKERFDYTMIGDSVNLASRLEGLNKEFGTYTMCSQDLKEATENKKPEIKWRELATVSVVGKKAVLTVFEPIPMDEYQKRETILNTFEKGRKLFYKGEFSEAQKIFETIADKDRPAAAYAKKCTELAGKPWEGIWIASGK